VRGGHITIHDRDALERAGEWQGDLDQRASLSPLSPSRA
jgi:hypothetical protein